MGNLEEAASWVLPPGVTVESSTDALIVLRAASPSEPETALFSIELERLALGAPDVEELRYVVSGCLGEIRSHLTPRTEGADQVLVTCDELLEWARKGVSAIRSGKAWRIRGIHIQTESLAFVSLWADFVDAGYRGVRER